MPKKAPQTRAATDLEMLAIAGAFKDTAVKKAKGELPENAMEMLNFTADFAGAIQKSAAIADGEMIPPKVDLVTLPCVCGLLKFLGYGPKRIKEALLSVGVVEPDLPEHDDLATAYVEATAEVAETLPKVPAKGKSAAVTSVISVRIHESAS